LGWDSMGSTAGQAGVQCTQHAEPFVCQQGHSTAMDAWSRGGQGALWAGRPMQSNRCAQMQWAIRSRAAAGQPAASACCLQDRLVSKCARPTARQCSRRSARLCLTCRVLCCPCYARAMLCCTLQAGRQQVLSVGPCQRPAHGVGGQGGWPVASWLADRQVSQEAGWTTSCLLTSCLASCLLFACEGAAGCPSAWMRIVEGRVLAGHQLGGSRFCCFVLLLAGMVPSQ